MLIDNITGWQAMESTDRDRRGRLVRVLIVKQSFEFSATGEVSIMEPGAPIFSREQYRGDPACSSLLAAAEVSAFKQGFEVYGQLVAWPPPDRPARIIAVALRFGRVGESPLLDKVLHVVGDRFWQGSRLAFLLGCRASEPEMLSCTPLQYEQAFGGCLGDNCYLANPVGTGFGGGRARFMQQALPRIELPGQGMQRPGQVVPVAGFGPLPRHWQPRLARQPDSDEATAPGGNSCGSEPVANIHNCAPDDQQLALDFGPGYQFELVGLLPDLPYGHAVTVKLPCLRPRVRISRGTGVENCPLRCDTLVIDGEVQCFHLVWRGSYPVDAPEAPVYWRLEKDASDC